MESVRAVQCFVTHLSTFHKLKDYMAEQKMVPNDELRRA
jgi:hypothetical protein